MARVYVIMPVRIDDNYEAKRAAIVDAFGGDAILPSAADSNASSPAFDIAETVYEMRQVDFVIADLSFERPSCYYELGMAQAMQLPALVIAQHGTQLHQHFGTVTFYRDLDEYRQIIASGWAPVGQDVHSTGPA